jgi:serine/threonine protein kinase/Tfp pilus assembly protein PilF
MSRDSQTVFERLTPEEAALIDATCDRFERAWKAAIAGSEQPSVESFMVNCEGAAREALYQELTALDRQCQERYGTIIEPQLKIELGAPCDDPATATTKAMDRATVSGTSWPTIPGLQLLKIIGSGGMGVVFKARQTSLDREVAVKLLREDHRTDSEHRERFLQEAKAVARLRHANLVQVYECGELPAGDGVASRPYLVLEYVAGGSLAEIVRGAPQPAAEAARLVEAIAGAIHYAHQQGVVHRDLKPANVLLQGDADPTQQKDAPAAGRKSPGRPQPTAGLCPKVTDFGLAKLLEGNDLTLCGDVLGTPSYMAPEQTSGKPLPITAAVDIYGLGAILYETLTGRPPFTSATVEATIDLVRHEEPVPPRRLEPTVPRDLETICLKCLRKEPARRYATAQDLADDLGRYQNGEPIRARPVNAVERTFIWCRRNPRVAALLIALLFVFLAGSAGVFWQWQKAKFNLNKMEYERDKARLQKARAEHRLQLVCDRVDRLSKLGQSLVHNPLQYRIGKAVLEEALAFCQQLLPEESNDPRIRREAATLYRQLGEIYHALGQEDKAAESYAQQARLIDAMLKEKPGDHALRMELADAYRWRANELRFLHNIDESKESYDQAAKVLQELLDESPKEARYRMALANTLLNTAYLLTYRAPPKELDERYVRILELFQAAVDAEPDNVQFNTELALGLEEKGRFLLQTGRTSDAEAAVRAAMAINQRLLDGNKNYVAIDRALARNVVNLGRIQAAAGQAQEAEASYRKAVEMLERRVIAEFPESHFRRVDYVQTKWELANLLRDAGRPGEAEEPLRRVIDQYERLRREFPDDAAYRKKLVQSYLDMVRLLFGFGQQAKADETFQKALAMASEDPTVNDEIAWFLATNPEPRLRNSDQAVQLANKAVAAKPESGDYLNTLGVAHYRAGDNKAAIADLEKSMSLRAGGESADWFFLAMAQWHEGKRDEARECFERATQWMKTHKPGDHELLRFRAEAETLIMEARKP